MSSNSKAIGPAELPRLTGKNDAARGNRTSGAWDLFAGEPAGARMAPRLVREAFLASAIRLSRPHKQGLVYQRP